MSEKASQKEIIIAKLLMFLLLVLAPIIIRLSYEYVDWVFSGEVFNLYK